MSNDHKKDYKDFKLAIFGGREDAFRRGNYRNNKYT